MLWCAYNTMQGDCPCGPPPTNASPPEPKSRVESESEESEIGTSHPFLFLAAFPFS